MMSITYKMAKTHYAQFINNSKYKHIDKLYLAYCFDSKKDPLKNPCPITPFDAWYRLEKSKFNNWRMTSCMPTRTQLFLHASYRIIHKFKDRMESGALSVDEKINLFGLNKITLSRQNACVIACKDMDDPIIEVTKLKRRLEMAIDFIRRESAALRSAKCDIEAKLYIDFVDSMLIDHKRGRHEF